MKKVYTKLVEQYLKQNFPKKVLVEKNLVASGAELYGTKGIQILVVEKNKEVFYQVITK